jgi:hypothetical protein
MDILTLGLIAGGLYILTRKSAPVITAPVSGNGGNCENEVPEISGDTGYIPIPSTPPVTAETYRPTSATQMVVTENAVVVVPPNTPASVVDDMATYNAISGPNPRIHEIPEIKAWADLDTEQAAIIYGQSKASALAAISRVFNMGDWVARWNTAVATYLRRTEAGMIRDYGAINGARYFAELAKPYSIVSFDLIEPYNNIGALGRWHLVTSRPGETTLGFHEVYGEGFPESVENWEIKAGMRSTYSDELLNMITYMREIRR